MDLRDLMVSQSAYFSLLAHTKQLLLMKFCDKTAECGVSFQTKKNGTRKIDPRTDGQTDVEVEIVI